MKTRKSGFTLVELLVVIAIIALLMGILMPSLARVRIIANRMMCGTHLADIGKAMQMYAEENRARYPQGGLPSSVWSSKGYILSWDATARELAFDSDGEATVTSSFYLLIKYGNATPKQFICPDDADAEEFALKGYKTNIKELVDAWDFGDNPGICCSYSYNMPFPFTNTSSGGNTKTTYSLDSSSSPGSPLCADRNPYLDKNAKIYQGTSGHPNPNLANPSLSTSDGEYHDDKMKGNAAAHDRKAQNVLFNDGHVAAELYPNCGIDNDNIWKSWPSDNPTDEEREVGDKTNIFSYTPTQGVATPQSKDDACLVNERNDLKE